MRGKTNWLVFLSAAVLVTALYFARSVLATPSSGFTPKTIATGTFDEFDVFNQASNDSLPAGFGGDVWISLQKTKGRSDLYVQNNTWQVGGSTGWHTHPGQSLVIVTSGTLTEYDADCIPHVYAFVQGQPMPTFVDPGHGHAHIVRNEGSVVATAIAVQLVPYDPTKMNRRIDVTPAPATCSNIQ